MQNQKNFNNIINTKIIIVPFTTKGGTAPIGSECPIAQSPQQLKIRFLFLTQDDEVKILKKS